MKIFFTEEPVSKPDECNGNPFCEQKNPPPTKKPSPGPGNDF